jgi:hypothetical protein
VDAASETDPEVRDSVVYWFVLLETALERGNYTLAAEADAELRRLGVRVQHTRRHERQRAADAR